MSAAVEGLGRAVTAASGIRIARDRAWALRAALQKAAPEMSEVALLDALGDPERLRGLVEQVIDELTVQETYFMRESGPLLEIDWPGMLRDARARGHDVVRVWSAACATGEEAYTLAMLATEALGPSAPVTVIGTDISRLALTIARRAWYRGRALQRLDPSFVTDYMLAGDDGYVVSPAVRSLVRFDRHSLARDPSPPPAEEAFDLILCRNVLIYLDADAAAQVVGSLRAALRPGGSLILGVADRLCVPRSLLGATAEAVPARHVGHRDRGSPFPVARRHGRSSSRGSTSSSRPNAKPEPTPQPSALREAIANADAGRLEAAVDHADRALAGDPLNAEAFYIRALVQLARDDAGAAVRSLRSALYVEPLFGLAAFKLGRAYEDLGDRASALRAYRQALRALAAEQVIERDLLDHENATEVAAACAMRVHALSGRGAYR